MIGAGAAALLLFNGDIMGLSGIFTTAILHPITTARESPWKFVFVASFFSLSSIFYNFINASVFQQLPGTSIPSTLAYALGGLLVGFGTKMGNGCTSGHGICGLARLSRRSIVAVGTFMATGIATTLLVANNTTMRVSPDSLETNSSLGAILAGVSVLACLPYVLDKKSIGAAISGGLSAVGLAISGMILSAKLENFLNVSLLTKGGGYDPTLMCVMGAGVVTSWIGYQLVPSHSMVCSNESCLQKPLKDDAFHIPTSTTLDWKLISGEVLFGIGWGLSDFCPGPAFVQMAGSGMLPAIQVWFPGFLIGSFCAEKVKDYIDSLSKPKTNDDATKSEETGGRDAEPSELQAPDARTGKDYGSIQQRHERDRVELVST